MSIYDIPERITKARGIDYDLVACLEYNVDEKEAHVLDIDRVLAVVEGERDAAPWHWLILMRDGRTLYLKGGCDYTGWDCQSWAETHWFFTAGEALASLPTIEEDADNYSPPLIRNIRALLEEQLTNGKATTHSEKLEQEFGR